MRFAIVVIVFVACDKGAPSPRVGSNEAPLCKTDDDCEVSCEAPDACCGHPCGCSQVQSKAASETARKHNETACTAEARTRCPQVGGCSHEPVIDDITPRCKAGACVAEVHKKLDPMAFGTNCSTAADCAIVKRDPCAKCVCADMAIMKAGLDRYNQAAQTITCAPDERVCGECKPLVADCVNGSCVAK